jgi:hypothetical protein
VFYATSYYRKSKKVGSEIMSETFREKGAKKEEEKPVLKITPQQDLQMHPPLNTLYAAAKHARAQHENTLIGGAKAVASADFDMRVARNFSDLRTDIQSLSGRFLAMLERLGS